MIDLKTLWEIQALDLERRSLEGSLQEGDLARKLRALKNGIEENRAEFNGLKEEYSGQKKELKKREMDITNLEEKIRFLGNKLYDGTITNVKEIANTDRKMENLREEVKRTEDLMLAIMEKLEELRRKMESLSSEMENKATQYRRLHGTYLGNQQNIRKMLARIPLARQKLLDVVDKETWKKYVEMKKKLIDPLARVEKGACMGCRVGIPFNDLRTLKLGECLVYCQNCGRMLFWEK
ncbi:MAG: zinc ribbon domain-containing protein [Eubacteriales bacterium]